MQELPVPGFYDPDRRSDWNYGPDQQALFERADEWRRRHRIKPSGTDEKKIRLLLVDVQKDFCFPEGALFVGGRSGTGAIDDNDRIARFIYHNLPALTDINCTMDTHFPFQIFFPGFWLGEHDRPLKPHRVITANEIRSKAVRPNPAMAWWISDGDYEWLCKQVEFYCDELEKTGKYRLYLWPPHCILGSPGHALAGVIHEARLFHAYARGSKSSIEVKGDNPLTENYSVLAPEVRMGFDGRELARRNTAFVRTLIDSDAVVIAGQAASHCVKSSIEDLLGEMLSENEALVHRVYILEDCMSAVAVPDPEHEGEFLFDFTPQAEEALRRFADAGMHVVKSSDPIDSWPGI